MHRTRRWILGTTLALATASVPAPTVAAGPTTAPAVLGQGVANGRISYVVDSRGCDDCHLFTVEPDGGDRVKLTNQGAGGAGWAPDGSRLVFPAFVEDGRVGSAAIDADGTGFELFEIPDPTLNLACWAWSPDGERFSCEAWDETQAGRSGIYTVSSTDGQDLQRLTTNPFGGADFVGDYSPDGTRYAFVRENPQRTNGTFAIFVVDANGGDPTRLSAWRTNADSVSWSPDGERLLVGLGDGSLATMAIDGTDVTPIDLRSGAGFAYAFTPSWSPDGTRIVFAMYLRRLNQVDIFTAAIDGTDVVQLTNSRREDGFPDWGPATT